MVFVLLLAALPASATTVTIGEPADPDSGNCFPFGCSSGTRYQQVYNAALFPGSLLINEIEFFNTQSHTATDTIDTATYEIHLSATTKAVNGLDTVTFDNNVGANDTLFFNGVLGGPIGGMTLTIVGAGFLYNTADGNLLLDIFKSGSLGDGNLYLDARNGTFGTDSSRAHNFGTAFEEWGLVTGFSDEAAAVPEPGSLFLLGSGLVGVGTLWRRRRHR